MSADRPPILELFAAYPGRSAVLSIAPLVLAAAQGANAVVHGLTSPLIVAFVLGMVAFAVVVTRHHLAAFQTESLETSWSENRP